MNLFGLQIGRRKKAGDARSRQLSNRPRIRIRSYDAAATNRHNKNHWLYADARDADSLIRADLATLRNRARYEIRNNSIAKGITETKANDLIGTGPILQLTTDNPEFDSEVEDKFKQWAEQCDAGGKMSFADILRLIGSLQQDESGEGVVVFQNAPAQKSWSRAAPQVRLRLMVVEPDRLTMPGGLLVGIAYGDEKIHDGIEFDENGRPLFYYIMKKHPGSTFAGGMDAVGDFDKVPAAQVIHLYRQDRPGQSRGVPRIIPGLPLLANLRRFTKATIEAAETAANMAAVLEGEVIGDEEDALEAMDEIEIPRNSILTVPGGTKMNQLKAEHPAPTYKEFRDAIINEYARSLVMPFNVASGNSAGYNYASGRLDKQEWFKFIKTERRWIEIGAINRIFRAWLGEAMLIPGYFKNRPSRRIQITPRWFWPGQEHVDPVKEAVAQDKRLKNHTTNLSAEWAIQGKDWEREIRQRVKEKNLLKELGVIDESDTKRAMG